MGRMMISWVVRLFLQMIIVCLFLFSHYALAQQKSVGSLVNVIRDSTIINIEGEEDAAQVRAMIYAGDRITTQDNSWLTVNFFDLTRVVLRPNSELVIHEFAQTMDNGNIHLEIVKGGARITSGTIAESNESRFIVTTPAGDILGDKTEWVAQICDDTNCAEIEDNLSLCADFVNPEKQNQLFLSVYRGAIDLEYCPTAQRLDRGVSLVSTHDGENCHIIEEVPCFILADGELGRDQYRRFAPNLQSINEDADSRVQPPRPNRDRPTIPRPIR